MAHLEVVKKKGNFKIDRFQIRKYESGNVISVLNLIAVPVVTMTLILQNVINNFNHTDSEVRATPAAVIATACIAIDGSKGPFTFQQATQRGVVGTNHMPKKGELGYINSMSITYPSEVQTGDMNSWVKMSQGLERTGEIEGYTRIQNIDGSYSYYCD
ncbi:MAG: hypothetical protein UR56_C0016G0020 [Candidatus Roizmanbacteria bacterium GW2011_GWC2_34_23]|uniref:Uncharacterized protein n=1 Tax=Candidatus Roizmanbacteria bacterium GW2011_GWC2_34_23 TaxID=1618484 RepID=A0A0G0AVQ3_9BACT|nr:MAG: hypothetical protein UR56_C0016G0020 [Candidatus Roizmanbacteria bacterium GW2011_GWC2_34_23]